MSTPVNMMRNTAQLTDLSPWLDLRQGRCGLHVYWRGVERGTVELQRSDRAYHVARDTFGDTRVVGDHLGEAVAFLVPELREVA